MKTKVFPVILIVIALFGCSNPESAFQKAEQENTIAAYESFIRKYPNDTLLVKSAKNSVYSLAYNEALQKNTIDAFNEYLEKYKPDSIYIQKATENLSTLKFENVKKENTLKAYVDYMKEYPNNKFQVEVNNYIDSVSFTLIPNVINNSIMLADSWGNPERWYSGDGLLRLKLIWNGSFPTGAIGHFYFIYTGESKNVKFIVDCDGEKKESDFNIVSSKYSLDVYLVLSLQTGLFPSMEPISVSLISPKRLKDTFKIEIEYYRASISKLGITKL